MCGLIGGWVVFGPSVWVGKHFHNSMMDHLSQCFLEEMESSFLIQIKAVVHLDKSRDVLEYVHFSPIPLARDVGEIPAVPRMSEPPLPGDLDCNMMWIKAEEDNEGYENGYTKKGKQTSILDYFRNNSHPKK